MLDFPLKDDGFIYFDIYKKDSYMKISERLYAFNLDISNVNLVSFRGERIYKSKSKVTEKAINLHQIDGLYEIFLNVGIRFVEKAFIKLYINPKFQRMKIFSGDIIYNDMEQISLYVQTLGVSTIKQTQYPVLIEIPYPIMFTFFETYKYRGDVN